MKTTSDKVGQSLALKNVARALEYKGQIGKACEVWHEVRKLIVLLRTHKVRWSVSSDILVNHIDMRLNGVYTVQGLDMDWL